MAGVISAMGLSDGLLGLVSQVGSIGRWLQALGIVIIVGITFEIIMLWLNFKRIKKMDKIMDNMKRIEKKIDGLKRK